MGYHRGAYLQFSLGLNVMKCVQAIFIYNMCALGMEHCNVEFTVLMT